MDDSKLKVAETEGKHRKIKKKERKRSTEPLKRVEAWWTLKEKSNEEADKNDELSSIMLKFVTKQQQYAIPQTAIAVRENIDSEGLNNLIYAFLEKGGIVVEIPTFEFMINGKILPHSIGKHLTEADISFETTTEVEYFERHPPPTPKDNLEHDDWVASVMCCNDWLLTGCYDNTVQLWSCQDMQKGRGKRAHKLTIPAHKAPVKAVSWIQTEKNVKSFVSCSIDQTAIVWEWNSKTNSVECLWECRGHTHSVECLSVGLDAAMFATGSWDNSLKIWDAANNSGSNFEHDDNEPDKKKLKKKKQERLKTPLMTLVGHSESVSAVGWKSDSQVISCSWDHSIRMWDVEIGGMASQINGNVAFFCLSYSNLNQLILAGCADRHIRLYDTRINDGSIVQNKFSSHTKWVPTVRWSSHDEHLFVSGSYDNSTRVWDTRSAKSPLYNLLGHSEKILSVDWSLPNVIASGSADCTAQLYSV